MEVEYLPVYNPSDAEKADPILYANNVRAAMGKALSVPLSEMGNEDFILAYYVGAWPFTNIRIPNPFPCCYRSTLTWRY